MNTDKNKKTITVILNGSEGSYTPTLKNIKNQGPSTSLRYSQDDKNHAIIRVHLRSSVDYY